MLVQNRELNQSILILDRLGEVTKVTPLRSFYDKKTGIARIKLGFELPDGVLLLREEKLEDDYFCHPSNPIFHRHLPYVCPICENRVCENPLERAL